MAEIRMTAALIQFLKLLPETLRAAERFVDAREPDIGNLIDRLQFIHDKIADLLARNFRRMLFMKRILHLSKKFLRFLLGTRTLLESPPEPFLDLLPVVLFATAVLLLHGERESLRLLVGAEARLAGLTFPPAPDSGPFLGLTRIDDFGIGIAAERTFHMIDFSFSILKQWTHSPIIEF